MTPTPPPSLPNGGWAALLRGLTPATALAYLLLLCGLVPAFVVYRMVTDPELIDRFLSHYSVEQTGGSACRIVKARQRGEDYTYAVVTGFAFEGGDRWSIGVTMQRVPTAQEIESNCAVLSAIIDFMHGSAPPPTIIWQAKDIQGREGLKDGR